MIFKGPHVYDNTGYCQFVIEVINKLSVDLSIDTCTRSFEDDMQSRRPNRPRSFICKDICLLYAQTDYYSTCIHVTRLKVPLAYFIRPFLKTVRVMVWYGHVPPSGSPFGFSAFFSTSVLWGIELKFCIWLCNHVSQIKFACQ